MSWFGVVVTGVAAFLVFAWLLRARNRLVVLRHRVNNARKQIEVQLTRRHDLIPALVDTVKGAMSYESGTLERLVRVAGEAREALMRAASHRETGDLMFDFGDAPYLGAEARLTNSLSQTLALIDKHPTLYALTNVQSLQEELSSTENRIAFARQHYNDSAANYNAGRESFPASLFSSGHGPAAVWEMPSGSDAMPKIDLRLTAPSASAAA